MDEIRDREEIIKEMIFEEINKMWEDTKKFIPDIKFEETFPYKSTLIYEKDGHTYGIKIEVKEIGKE